MPSALFLGPFSEILPSLYRPTPDSMREVSPLLSAYLTVITCNRVQIHRCSFLVSNYIAYWCNLLFTTTSFRACSPVCTCQSTQWATYELAGSPFKYYQGRKFGNEYWNIKTRFWIAKNRCDVCWYLVFSYIENIVGEWIESLDSAAYIMFVNKMIINDLFLNFHWQELWDSKLSWN